MEKYHNIDHYDIKYDCSEDTKSKHIFNASPFKHANVHMYASWSYYVFGETKIRCRTTLNNRFNDMIYVNNFQFEKKKHITSYFA